MKCPGGHSKQQSRFILHAAIGSSGAGGNACLKSPSAGCIQRDQHGGTGSFDECLGDGSHCCDRNVVYVVCQRYISP